MIRKEEERYQSTTMMIRLGCPSVRIDQPARAARPHHAAPLAPPPHSVSLLLPLDLLCGERSGGGGDCGAGCRGCFLHGAKDTGGHKGVPTGLVGRVDLWSMVATVGYLWWTPHAGEPPFRKQQVDVTLESACCKRLFQVLQMFQRYAVSVSYGCCKNRSMFHMAFQMYAARVFICMLHRLHTYVDSVLCGCCVCLPWLQVFLQVF
jgi:hypothetical protein